MVNAIRARKNRAVVVAVPFVLLCAVVILLVLGVAEPAAARGSALRFGGDVNVEPGERLDGDVVLFNGKVHVLGEVFGDVVVVGGSATIDGTVSGDVTTVGGSITLGPTAVVRGDATSVGGSVTRDPAAIVRGQVSTLSVGKSLSIGFSGLNWWGWRSFSLPFTLLYVAGLFVLTLLGVAIIPDNVEAVEQHMDDNVGRAMVIGLVAMLLIIPLSLILIVTIIGAPLLWLGFAAAMLVGYIALVKLLGRKVMQSFSPDAGPVWELVVGVLIIAVLRYVPVFGGLFMFIATVWGVGSVLDTKFGTNRPWLPARKA